MPSLKARCFSRCFAAYTSPSRFEDTLYTVAKVPEPILPTILYFPPPFQLRPKLLPPTPVINVDESGVGARRSAEGRALVTACKSVNPEFEY